MPTSDNRRFPRVSVTEPATLEIRSEEAGGRPRVPATIVSITCEGAGIRLGGLPEKPIRQGQPLLVRFDVDGESMEMPSQVVWAGDVSRGEPAELGVRFHLEAAMARSRQRYASWIVRHLSKPQRRPTPRPR